MKLPEAGTYEFEDMTVRVGPHPRWKYFCAIAIPKDSPNTTLELKEETYELRFPTNHDCVAGLAHIAMLGIVINSVHYGYANDGKPGKTTLFDYADERSAAGLSLMRRADLLSNISPDGLSLVSTGTLSFSTATYNFPRYAAWSRAWEDEYPHNYYVLSGEHEHKLLEPDLVAFIDSAVAVRDRSTLPTLGFRLALLQEYCIDQYDSRVEAERVLQTMADGPGQYAF